MSALRRAAPVAALCLALSAVVGAGRAGADEIELFDRLCFPDLKDARTFAERAARAGWSRAELTDHPKIAQAVGNLASAPDAKIATLGIDIYKTRLGSRPVFAIFQETESRSSLMQGRINKCHLYDFEATKPADDAAFRKRYFSFETPDGQPPASLHYVRIRNVFLTAGKPKDDPPEPSDRGLDGVHLSASYPVE